MISFCGVILHFPHRACGEERLGCKKAYMMLPDLTKAQQAKLGIQAWRSRDEYLRESDRKIKGFSRKLEGRIRQWLAGRAGAKFPKGFLPPYIDNEKTHSWKLVPPNKISPKDQWYALKPYDPQKVLYQFSPDPHVTYLKLIFLAPLGSKLIVEGQFPHARFMDYQILGPVDPRHPVTGQMGICEVPIVDVDIKPLPGNVNPFRPGANRNAKNRRYKLTFDLRAGNAVTLNPKVMKPPAYRALGNTRVGGPFAFAGPWGGNVLVPSVLWIRYYAPDKNTGPFAGVPLPKATLQLSTGEKFWITCNKSLAVSLQTQPVPRVTTPPTPYRFIGPSLGWFKMYGIMHLHSEGRGYYKSKPWGKDDPAEAKKKIRRNFMLMFNRGPKASAPGNFECGATCCNYISYLCRPTNLGHGKVLVLTGKLPAFPRTRNGEKKMTTGQVRYLSITHQLGIKPERGTYGTPYGSLMDDEIAIDKDRRYVIVYSRKKDRPKNARRKYGVTWQEWGSPSSQTFVVRWMSVMPKWYLPKLSPHENNIPWSKGAWSSVNYDKSIVGRNRPGIMKAYHPVFHYMTTQRFEAMGKKQISPADVPEWTSWSR
ncbi:MAG: hypothetical protein K8S55_15005 [Phycisphaerae bacterium]|nr:hypothetical protein [Phycisphaerae bacterium]